MKIRSKIAVPWKHVVRLVLLIACGGILGVNIYLANANSLVGNKLPMPFGYGAAVVLSGSMEPTFSRGDLIIVKATDSYEINDIVVFQEEHSLVVHRLLEEAEETIITKGDANNVADEPVDKSLVKGIVIGWIPYLGSLVELLKTPVGTAGTIIAAIALIEIPYRRDRKKNEQTRREIIEEIQRLKEENKR